MKFKEHRTISIMCMDLEAYLEPGQISMMERFAKIVNRF